MRTTYVVAGFSFADVGERMQYDIVTFLRGCTAVIKTAECTHRIPDARELKRLDINLRDRFMAMVEKT